MVERSCIIPSSVEHGKKDIKDWFDKQEDIRLIVDVGPGSGTYAKLLGTKYCYNGIEIWGPYIKKWELNKLYSEVIVSDIRHVKLPPADCIIFGDVLEHLPKEDALEVVREARKKYKHMVISVPLSTKGHFYKGRVCFCNDYEEHISAWTFIEVKKLAHWSLAKEIRGIGVFCK